MLCKKGAETVVVISSKCSEKSNVAKEATVLVRTKVAQNSVQNQIVCYECRLYDAVITLNRH